MRFQKYWSKITFVRLLFLKVKQKKNMKTNFFTVFISNSKMAFFEGSTNFFQFKLLNNRHTNVILISILQAHKKRPKTAKMVFLTVKTFFCAFSKYQLKEHLCVYCFKSWIKAEKWRNISLRGFSLKTKNAVFCIWNLGPFGI